MSTTYAVIDIETTGGSPRRDKIIEVGIIVYDGEKEIERFESLIDPGITIPPQIIRLTGITNQMVEDAPKFYEVAKKIVEITKGAIFVAHNVRFDYNFIREEFARLGYTYTRKQLCTKRLAKISIDGLRSYSLESLIHYFGIKVNSRHRALDDAYAASVVLDQVLNKKGNDALVWDLIHQGVKESRLPASISLEYLHAMPEDCGVYYFHNKSSDVIYVGKSINIKDRILQHFADHTEKSTHLHQQVESISYEIFGSELLALLKENEEIKKIKPEINRQLRKKAFPIGLYEYTDQNGYLRFMIQPITDDDPEMNLIKKFTSNQNAKAFLNANIERYQLCLKLSDIEKYGGPCFNYHIEKCMGACMNNEDPELYNQRAIHVLGKNFIGREEYIIREEGRTPTETTLLWIKNGKCYGYLYKNEYDQIPLDESNFTTLLMDEDAGVILRNYLAKNKVYRQSVSLFA